MVAQRRRRRHDRRRLSGPLGGGVGGVVVGFLFGVVEWKDRREEVTLDAARTVKKTRLESEQERGAGTAGVSSARAASGDGDGGGEKAKARARVDAIAQKPNRTTPLPKKTRHCYDTPKVMSRALFLLAVLASLGAFFSVRRAMALESLLFPLPPLSPFRERPSLQPLPQKTTPTVASSAAVPFLQVRLGHLSDGARAAAAAQREARRIDAPLGRRRP